MLNSRQTQTISVILSSMVCTFFILYIYFHVLEALVHIQNSFRFIDGETAQVLYTCIKIKQLHFINDYIKP